MLLAPDPCASFRYVQMIYEFVVRYVLRVYFCMLCMTVSKLDLAGYNSR